MLGTKPGFSARAVRALKHRTNSLTPGVLYWLMLDVAGHSLLWGLPALGMWSWVVWESKPSKPWRSSQKAASFSVASAHFLHLCCCLECLSWLLSMRDRNWTLNTLSSQSCSWLVFCHRNREATWDSSLFLLLGKLGWLRVPGHSREAGKAGI